MKTQRTHWPDEIEALDVLAAAAHAVNGTLTPQDGRCWALDLPRLNAPIRVSLTANSVFPLALETSQGTVAWTVAERGEPDLTCLWEGLEGGYDASELVESCPSGWVVVAAGETRVQLMRVDQSKRGWPTAAQIRVASPGLAMVETDVTLGLVSETGAAVLDHFLARLRESLSLVDIRWLSQPTRGEEVMTGNEQTRIRYRLAALPRVCLAPPQLAAALALVGRRFEATAPVLRALSSCPSLARAYLAMHGVHIPDHQEVTL
jgi:hypothetical protein